MITLKNVTKSTATKVLFENISFKLADTQKVGFVGPNGSGKTTLLKIIAGFEEPDRGEINTSGEVIGYLSQKIDADESTMIYEYMYKALKNDWQEYTIKTSLARVGLGKVDQSEPISTLSGGQKMKLGLAKILLNEPTTLLLDEPTNNLDMQSLLWLEKFVKRFEGKVLLVSHDRAFLDNCVNKIIELDHFNKTIHEYGGNYSEYLIQKAERQKNLLAEYNLQQKKEQHMQDWIHERQERLKYHQSVKGARQLKAMKSRMKREVDDNRVLKPQEYSAFTVDSIANAMRKQKSILILKDFKIPGLLECDELYLFSHNRIYFAGKNGTGKTTFIKTVMGVLKNYEGELTLNDQAKIGYFSQEHELLRPNESLIDNFIRLTPVKSGVEARKILGAYLFPGDTVFGNTKYLSEGEKARLIFAILITQKNDFLLLDEPTNHLDLQSREVIETALKEYEGGFLVVSHDRYFINTIGINKIIEIRDKVIQEVKKRG